MINVKGTVPSDLSEIQSDLAESYGGTIEEMRSILLLRGNCVTFRDGDNILAILGVTRPDETGTADLCTLYTYRMQAAPFSVLRIARQVVASLQIPHLEFCLPEGTDGKFARLIGFKKISSVNGYDVYRRSK